MRISFMFIFSVALAVPSFAGATCFNTVTIAGAPAAEIFEKLNIKITPVRDEHGSPTDEEAKEGRLMGCIRKKDGQNPRCFAHEPVPSDPSGNCR